MLVYSTRLAKNAPLENFRCQMMESEALQTLSDFFCIDFKDMDEAMILVRENNDNNDGRV